MALDRPFAAVIFDLDSTLVDSLPSIGKAWTTWAVEYGLTEEQFADFHGHSSAAIVEALVPDRVEEANARIEALEVAEVADCRPLPGAVEALAAVPARRRAIATSGTRAVATARLGAAGIEAPTVFVTADDVERAKPAPDLFLTAAERLGVDPADCLVCEDAPAGIEAARAAGCGTLAVTTTNPEDKLPADLVVADLAQVRFTAADDGIRVSRA